MPGEPDPQYILARRVLLDALTALGAHTGNIVVIGAQAVYHWTQEAELQVAAFTSDADLAIDPRELGTSPLIEQLLETAGFSHRGNPGEWVGAHDVPLDLMVPTGLASAEGRRGARIPPHAVRVARKAAGIEGCVVDMNSEVLSAFDPADERSLTARIAGPAALMVAKLTKIQERAEQPPHRLVPKDALDLHRLLIARSAEELADRFALLLEDEASEDATMRALASMARQFAHADASGPTLVARAIGVTGASDADAERQRSFELARRLLRRLPQQP